jgi:hypothetical protein
MIAVAALLALALPASAGAAQGFKAECETQFCGGVSEDGTRAVFPFYEELTPGAGRAQVYERFGGVTRALIPYPDKPPSPAYAGLVGLSSDARHAFVSTNLPLVPEDHDGGATDVYDIFEGAASLLSTGPADTQSGPYLSGPTALPAFFQGASADGRRVFLDSAFAPLTADDTDNCPDIYERFEGQTRLISTGPTATASFPEHLCAAGPYDGLSADGTHVFFTTGDNLVPEDEAGDDIYQLVGDVRTVLTTYPEVERNCVDLPKFGGASADGRTVLFSTNMPISPEDKDSTADVYKREPDGSYVLVSRGTEGGIGPCGFGGDRAVALSADGGTAIFETEAQLSPEDKDSAPDLYRAAPDGSISLVTTGPADASSEERVRVLPQWPADVSDDANNVAFETRQQLVPEDTDQAVDVYLWANGQTELVSTGPAGGNAPIKADLLSISGDGQTVAFATKEPLTDEDTDHKMDFYLRRYGQVSRPASASASAQRRTGKPGKGKAGKGRTVLLSAEAIPPRMRVSSHARLTGSGKVGVRLGCPKSETSGPCRGRVSLAAGRHGKALGSATFRVPAGKSLRVFVSLPANASPRSLFARVRGADRLGNAATTVHRVSLAFG